MDSKKEGSDSNFRESKRSHQKSHSMKEGRRDPPSIFSPDMQPGGKKALNRHVKVFSIFQEKGGRKK